MTDKNKNDLLEKYLLGQLDEEEIAQFQFELIRDPELQAALAEQEMIMKTLWTPKAKAIEQPKQYRLLRVLFGILIIGLSLYFLLTPTGREKLQNKQKPEKTPAATTELVQPEAEVSIPAQTLPPEQKTEQPETAKPKPSAKKTPVSDESNSSKSQVIADNFLPNPEWQNYIGSKLRSNGLQFIVENPAVEYADVQGALRAFFTIKGTIKTQEETVNKRFQLHFFSNKMEDFQQFRPIKSWDIMPQKKDGNFVFTLKEPIDINPGRYYSVIENTDSGIWYWVGEVVVEGRR